MGSIPLLELEREHEINLTDVKNVFFIFCNTLEITVCSQRCDYSQKVRTLPAVYYISKVIMGLKLFSFHSYWV